MRVDGMEEIAKLLPGYNCGECGERSCQKFAEALLAGDEGLIDRCPPLRQERHRGARSAIEELLHRPRGDGWGAAEVRGVIDGLAADFSLAPLPGEPSCREDLFPFDREARLEVGAALRYRPLGCPVTHFARAIKVDHGLVTVHVVGPRHLLGDRGFAPREVGVCLVAAFEGVVLRGRVPGVGETVRFLPEDCMMQKVHSGVIVHSEGRMVRIEGIDLKVW